MVFILITICTWLFSASLVHAQQGQSRNATSLEIYSGADLVKAIAATSGPETLLLASDYTWLTAADFAGKLRLGNGVTLTLRWAILLDLFDDVSSGASTELFAQMPDGMVGTMALQHAAYSAGWCYPPEFVSGFIGLSARPDSIPGINTYNASADIPGGLRAMGGGLYGVGTGAAVGCTTDIFAPPMRRCWGHVAYCQDFAVRGGVYNENRQYVRNGYLVHLVDTYMLCKKLLDLSCLIIYSPYGCLKRQQIILSSSNMNNTSNTTTTAAPGGSVPGANRYVPVPSGTGPADPALQAPSGEHLQRAMPAVLTGSIVGGLAMMAAVAAVAAFAVISTRRRREQQQQQPAKESRSSYDSQMCDFMAVAGSSVNRFPSERCLSFGLRSSPDQGLGNVGEKRRGIKDAALAVDAKMAAAAAAAAVITAGRDKNCADAATTTTGNNSSECDLGSDVPVHPSRGPAGLNFKPAAAPPPPLQHDQQESADKQQAQAFGAEHGAPQARAVQLWQDPDQKVTLLPTVRGKGSYGKVCEGLYGNQRVAVKLVREFFAGNGHSASDEIAKTFAQEVEVLGRCCHPNVVRLLAACIQPPQFCLVMELMETSLQRLVFGGTKKQLLPLPMVLHIGCEIAQALAYLHPTIVHRDLKPDNVLLSKVNTPEPIVKVSDFGLSRLRCTVASTKHPEAGTGRTCGERVSAGCQGRLLRPFSGAVMLVALVKSTKCFDLCNKCITHHVDIYSWAVVMWTMLCGVEPWKGCGIVEIAYRVTLLDERLLLDNAVAAGRCPPRLQRLLIRCWDRVPDSRPAASEIVKEIMLIMQHQECPTRRNDLDAKYMATSPHSVLNRIREYQDAATAAAAAATSTTSVAGTASLEDVAVVPADANAHMAPFAKAPVAGASAARAACSTAAASDVYQGIDVGVLAGAVAAVGLSATTAAAAGSGHHQGITGDGDVPPQSSYVAAGSAAAAVIPRVSTGDLLEVSLYDKDDLHGGAAADAAHGALGSGPSSPVGCGHPTGGGGSSSSSSGSCVPFVPERLTPGLSPLPPPVSLSAGSFGRTRWFSAESVRVMVGPTTTTAATATGADAAAFLKRPPNQ
ncbi:hypothetical protein VOLCADRAFT_98940 [Volvox carteri f. nagariensis]|uniref:Protein kinase domain-containing protein n=1 Tax=Volvox carteri f. nagariensis TaxID=3068 RepID=D8UGN6_VOLCA|nr:uncharacterized protein VOLCADRAFT_98940 [Volvox carteri f. nagariensis]EFJ41152.1 hypothetical protein VOLCADRAFT_98940 [Volvox carteri f. nagariensis]|eukprot:XP_002957824.1 hypothetical protein VOLCADRAFT_98940 [Volvox carteri f. nagariensis]